MKIIRTLMVLAGLSLAALALGATGANAQQSGSLSTTNVSGTFSIPFEAQWGRTTLPAGDYSLYYGRSINGLPVVQVVGKAKGSPRAFILPRGVSDASATKSALVCVREGNVLVVRALEMARIGESARFGLPHGAQLTAHRRNGSTNTQLAEAPMLIQRVPVTLNAK